MQEPPRHKRDQKGPPGCSRNPLGVAETPWNQQKPTESCIDPLEAAGTHLEAAETTRQAPGSSRDPQEASGIPWKQQRPPGCVWHPLQVAETPSKWQKNPGPPGSSRDDLLEAVETPGIGRDPLKAKGAL